ncbi:MAG: LacI family transcriptional regulator [Cyclobacteriaceae bacterium]|nr:LacI family transcriptional regulator [Cyclobacteriaceae bacterium]
MKRNITIKDIARHLGISPSTVSRALKDNPEISIDTKKKVWKIAKELDYEPNPIALSLRQNKTHTIGIILPEIVHFFFSTVISGIEEVAYANGYNVIISQSNDTLEREILDTRALYSHRVDGILASISRETTNMEHFQAIQDKGIPLVFFDREVKDIDASKVIVDDFDGGYKATRHLIERGRSNLIHLAGPETLSITHGRKAGFVKAHEEAGIALSGGQIITCASGEQEEAEKIVNEIIASGRTFDGVFAVNDMAAFGALIALQNAGKRVPEDVAIVGFSNWQFSSLVAPPLTTIAQPGYLMGQKAAELLLNEIKMGENEFIEPVTIKLPVDLIVRKSS